jgi:hypothetical protein
MSEFDKICEECNENFSGYIETICDNCQDAHSKSIQAIINSQQKEIEVLREGLLSSRENAKYQHISEINADPKCTTLQLKGDIVRAWLIANETLQKADKIRNETSS